MRVVILPSAVDAGLYAAGLIREGIADGSVDVVGLSTGSSPLPVYRALASEPAPGINAVSAFALDEYVGLGPADPHSYHAVVAQEIVGPLGLDPARVHVPDGLAENLPQACLQYEKAIATAGGVDLQILGVGRNGHVGFNEPGSSLASRTRVVTLAASTRQDNARFFKSLDDVPVHALTQGVGTILEARRLLLIATGRTKAKAVAGTLEGPVGSMCPGSAVQLHPDVTVVLDEDAASELTLHDYHRFVFENASRR